jgi:hypothetical protein
MSRTTGPLVWCIASPSLSPKFWLTDWLEDYKNGVLKPVRLHQETVVAMLVFQVTEIIGFEALHKLFNGMVLIFYFVACPVLLLIHFRGYLSNEKNFFYFNN